MMIETRSPRVVPFRAGSGKYRTVMRMAAFAVARKDELTCTGLRGIGADLSRVTVA
jgi:hypothetical protein